MDVRPLVVVIIAVLAGCTAPPVVDLDRPTTRQVLEGCRLRADQLQQVRGYGIVEFTWTDERGDHFEQGNLEFWLDGPTRQSLRISALGEPYFWMGTDGELAWMFDLSQQPGVLYRGPLDSLRKVQETRETTLPLEEMLTVLPRLIGVIPPPAEVSEVRCRPDSRGRIWLEVPAEGTRTLLAEQGWQPRRIEMTGRENGYGLLLESPSPRQVRIEIPDRSELAWPRAAAVMDVRATSGPPARAKFAFDRMSTDMSDQPLDRVFDLATLQKALRAEIIRPLTVPESHHDRPDP